MHSAGQALSNVDTSQVGWVADSQGSDVQMLAEYVMLCFEALGYIDSVQVTGFSDCIDPGALEFFFHRTAPQLAGLL